MKLEWQAPALEILDISYTINNIGVLADGGPQNGHKDS